MGENIILKGLKTASWYELLHHKKGKKEKAEGAVNAALKHFEMFSLALTKIPEPWINGVLPKQKAKTLIQAIISNWPMLERLNILDNEIRENSTLQSEIERLIPDLKAVLQQENPKPTEEDKKQSEHFATEIDKYENKLKSLRRTKKMLKAEYDQWNKDLDEKRMELAVFMVQIGLDYVIRQYGSVIAESDTATADMEKLQSAHKVASEITEKMPELWVAHQAIKEHRRRKIEENRKKG